MARNIQDKNQYLSWICRIKFGYIFGVYIFNVMLSLGFVRHMLDRNKLHELSLKYLLA